MKTKDIIRPAKGGGCRIENENEDDKEVTTTVVISSVDYDVVDIDVEPKSKMKTGRSTPVAVYNDDVAADNDIVYNRNTRNNKYNVAFNDDYRYFGRTAMIDTAGFLISDKHYCDCGSVGGGAGNRKKMASLSSKKNNTASVKQTGRNYYEIDKIIADEVFDLNKNCVAAAAAAAAAATATVYATKKSLLLNEYLELNDDVSTTTTSVQRYYVNDPATTTTFVNRFVSEAANAGKCHLQSTTTSNGSATSAIVVENNGTTTTSNAASHGLSSSSSTLSTVSGKGCGTTSRNHSLCLNSSILLTDKRLVGLFRSVALYWFFCLNTVLAKGDHVFKRKAAVSPLNDGINEQLLLQRDTNSSGSLATSPNNLQLRICCPDVVLAVVGHLKNDNFLWDLKSAAAVDETCGGGNLLTWAEHSKAKLFDDLFGKVLRDLADNCGIFDAAKPPATTAKTTSSKRRLGQKNVEAATKSQAVGGGAEPNSKAVNTSAEERRRFLPPPSPPPVSPKKTNRSGKKMIGVRRKYIIDVLDYYYDDDDDDDEAENDNVGDGISKQRRGSTNGAGGGRASRTTGTAVVNRIIWKKRAVKNKLKSKRKLANAGVQQHQQQQRVQQIIIECYGGGGGGAADGYVINDGYEEVVGASEPTIEPPPPAPASATVVVDEELFIDFDSYAEYLKREVALRQQRKRKQPPSSGRPNPPPVIKIMEPSSSSKRPECCAEDDLSAGTGSTSSSLLMELEEEEESSSYFLPDGRYHSATEKYSKYDLWCSPLVVEKVWPVVEPAQPAPATRSQTIGGTSRIFKHAKAAAPAPAAPAATAFKPYRLWESSWAPEDDFIPSFVAARRHRRSPKYTSMVTMTGPAQPAAKTSTAVAGRRPTFGKEPAAANQSMYTLWGSPNIIDFLPGIGSGGSSGSIHLNDESCSSSRGTLSSSSPSPEESSSMEYEEYASSADTFELLKATAATMNEHGLDAFNHQHHHQFGVRGGKFLNLKPIINGFVSFTDRGAFEYYKKPAMVEATAATTTAITTPTTISFAVRTSRQSSVDSSENMSEVSQAAVDAATATDASDDVETNDVSVDTPSRSDYETPFHFKPIQPAFKVSTDTPASFERSESGTLWCNKQKLMTFKHELEDVSVLQQRRPRSRDAVHELDSFQPKFVVNGNDVGCQTEWFGLHGFESIALPMMGGQTTSSASFFTPVNEKKNSQDPSYVSGAALFYAWDEVFNFLNKPGLGNIDVKAHLDFSCFF